MAVFLWSPPKRSWCWQKLVCAVCWITCAVTFTSMAKVFVDPAAFALATGISNMYFARIFIQGRRSVITFAAVDHALKWMGRSNNGDNNAPLGTVDVDGDISDGYQLYRGTLAAIQGY
ncbi:hypothetical protein D9757_006747 [Collybiopsis confluens]|uniref:Uncharacterized protein n=1 Tax=Collybiopsis confluens TaxID=2823264 RepID=A0A8H5M9D3_9AGAR|nr:hypothetical protein D9757_006747 [Collybiopsis confluens]